MKTTVAELKALIKEAVAESLTPEQVVDFIRNEAEDRDDFANFARASTEEVAKHFNVPNQVAYKALNKAAKLGMVTKAGRLERDRKTGGFTFQGRTTGAVGFELWEVTW